MDVIKDGIHFDFKYLNIPKYLTPKEKKEYTKKVLDLLITNEYPSETYKSEWNAYFVSVKTSLVQKGIA